MTPTSGRHQPLLLDTSAAVAFAVADHEQHEATFEGLADLELGLAGHAAFETYSVLTRLPAPNRLTGAAATRLISTNFPHSRYLGARRTAALLAELPGRGVTGGSVYDALVGATAVEHDLTLVSLDRRALATYRELGVRVRTL